ncbi:MAG: mevalonate kinase [Candidatus Aenigmatarchaeota archaeon]
MIKVSAPGKVHLIGEHSVVYGEPAIISSIGLRCYATAVESDKIAVNDRRMNSGRFRPDEAMKFSAEMEKLWQLGARKNDFSALFRAMKSNGMNYKKAAVGKILNELGISAGAKLALSSDIPPHVGGMGSSAAFAIVLTKAIADLNGKKLSLERINDIAFGIERLQHGNPSGGDNTACCYGGLIWFQRQTNSNIITSMKNEVPYELENFALVNAGKREKSTGELIQHIRNLGAVYRDPRIKRLGAYAQEMRNALGIKDFKKIAKLMNEAQKTLYELGVSTPAIDKIAGAVRSIGGGAKLSGAGGGGIMLCYHENRDLLAKTIKKLGYAPIETRLGVEGVRNEER